MDSKRLQSLGFNLALSQPTHRLEVVLRVERACST